MPHLLRSGPDGAADAPLLVACVGGMGRSGSTLLTRVARPIAGRSVGWRAL